MSYEAEDCALTGDLQELNKRYGYSGRGYVRIGGDASRIECEISVPRAGKYLIRLRAMSPSGGKRVLVVNGAVVVLAYQKTASDSWASSQSLEVEAILADGSNRISIITANGSDGTLDIDRIEV